MDDVDAVGKWSEISRAMSRVVGPTSRPISLACSIRLIDAHSSNLLYVLMLKYMLEFALEKSARQMSNWRCGIDITEMQSRCSGAHLTHATVSSLVHETFKKKP